MLWDQAIVRNTYKLRPDPESFVSYQRFGWNYYTTLRVEKALTCYGDLRETTHGDLGPPYPVPNTDGMAIPIKPVASPPTAVLMYSGAFYLLNMFVVG